MLQPDLPFRGKRKTDKLKDKNIKKPLKNLIIALNSIFLIIIILFLPLRFYIYNFKFYERLYENNRVYENLDSDDARILTYDIFNFFKNNKELKKFDLKGEIQFFNQNEISHLEDVRSLINRIFIILYISTFLFLIFSALLLFEKKLPRFFRNISITALSASSFVLGLLLMLYFLGNNFPYLFENFHQVFFPQGNWQFPQGSLIITIFPFGFFYEFFFKLLTGSFIISIVLLIAGITGITITNKKLGKIKKNYEIKK